MIKRYSTKEMEHIWSDQNKFNTWKIVELAVVEIMAEKGIVPEESSKVIHEKADFNVDRVLEIEKETRHDVYKCLIEL